MHTTLALLTLSSTAFALEMSPAQTKMLSATFGTADPAQLGLLWSFFVLAGSLTFWIGKSVTGLYRLVKPKSRRRFRTAHLKSSWERSAKARNDIYDALNLSDSDGKTRTQLSKSIEIERKVRREPFVVLEHLDRGRSFLVECRISGSFAPWTRLSEEKIRPGHIYLKFTGKKFFLHRADESSKLTELLGQIRPGSVLSGRVLGLGHQGENFKLAEDGHWYLSKSPPSLKVALVDKAEGLSSGSSK